MVDVLIIEIYKYNNFIVLKPKGTVDLYSVSEFKKELFKFTDGNHEKVAVDLSNVDYMDSSGIGALVAGHKKMRAVRGNFIIFGIREDVLNIMKLATLDKFFHIIENEDNLPC
jgi:anti-sigma B factor antagonist